MLIHSGKFSVEGRFASWLLPQKPEGPSTTSYSVILVTLSLEPNRARGLDLDGCYILLLICVGLWEVLNLSKRTQLFQDGEGDCAHMRAM